jgi:hypothetical protein
MDHDLNSRLRALARAEHDDLSIGDEAADRIEELERERNGAFQAASTEKKLKDFYREVVRCAASFIGQPELEDLAKSIIRYAGYTRCERCDGSEKLKPRVDENDQWVYEPCDNPDCINGWREQ